MALSERELWLRALVTRILELQGPPTYGLRVLKPHATEAPEALSRLLIAACYPTTQQAPIRITLAISSEAYRLLVDNLGTYPEVEPSELQQAIQGGIDDGTYEVNTGMLAGVNEDGSVNQEQWLMLRRRLVILVAMNH